MAKVNPWHGTAPIMVDHTPTGDVTQGSVIVQNNYPMVAHKNIAANRLGALGARNGVYAGEAAAAATQGQKCYWLANPGQFTPAASGNVMFGYFAADVSGAGVQAAAIHAPDGTVGT